MQSIKYMEEQGYNHSMQPWNRLLSFEATKLHDQASDSHEPL